MAMRTTLLAAASFGAATAVNNGLGRVPALGWNTWCTVNTCGYDLCYEDEIKAIANAMVANGMRDAGYHYINLDDCWGYPRDPNTGVYRWDPDRFPNGIPALVKYVNSLGFDFGVYTDSGLYTCSQGGRSFKIPGSYGYYAQDAATFASWGVRYVKMDWCNTVVNGTQLDPHVVYANMSRGLNATGVPVWFESCEWGVDDPWLWMSNDTNSWRIGGDHHDTFSGSAPPSTEGVIELFANKSMYSGPGGWNYGDFIYTGGQGCAGQSQPGAHCPGQSDTEYMTEFSMWVMAASPIIVATNVINMTDIMTTVLLNKEMLAVHQDALAVAGDRVGFDGSCGAGLCQLWAKPLANGDVAAALYNRDVAPHRITLPFALLQPAWAGATLAVRDLWAHTDNGTATASLTASVDPHGVVVVRLSKA